MPALTTRSRSSLGALCVAVWGVSVVPSLAVAQSPDVKLATHRAVYELKLQQIRGKSSVEAVRGRILYDFSGSACEGYALQFRQVSELDTGEGKKALSDLRSTTWEDGQAKRFRFNSENLLNQQRVDAVDGSAERRADAIAVNLGKPKDKVFDLDARTVFPTEHMRRIIVAAREGKTLLEVPVYDGSETGEKVYNTLAVIGQPIAPDAHKVSDAAAGQQALAGLTRWPVTISYFDRAKTDGEQTPVYTIRFEVYENGVSRALTLDYNDFVISGEMTSLDIKETKPCP